jgi:hypothetical protein
MKETLPLIERCWCKNGISEISAFVLPSFMAVMNPYSLQVGIFLSFSSLFTYRHR